MGKKQKDLGKSLMRDRSGKKNKSNNSLLHTSELQDGQNYNRINFNSITEQTDVDSFLATAELAGTDFTAERLNTKFIQPSSTAGVLSTEEKTKIKLIQEHNKSMLRIPRRPPWDRSMDAEELAEAERENFLEWRRALSQLQDTDGIVMTPYERNIEFWRQLWRVIERSDVVAQIVDARNPLLFYCEDMSSYVKEVDANKENLLLVNKADFLTEQQREKWANYFESVGIKAVFFCAILETSLDDIEEESCAPNSTATDKEIANNLNDLSLTGEGEAESHNFGNAVQECQDYVDHVSSRPEPGEENLQNELDHMQSQFIHTNYINSSKLLTRKQLIEVFQNFYSGPKLHFAHVTIGLVGYPNVGKSSTINSLMQEKKVSVSATPGKTKHFQTLFLSNDILLCDCPGLVFPAFVSTKEEMIISGILSIDQMRDHVPPTNLLLSLLPRRVMEDTYRVRIPPPLEGQDPDRCPVSEEFLSVYGYLRGFMTPRGIPDHPRTARYVLKDYINGKLMYCHCPPGEAQEEYHKYEVEQVRKAPVRPTPHQLSALPQVKQSAAIDAAFFKDGSAGFHYKGVQSIKDGTKHTTSVSSSEGEASVAKSWRVKPTRAPHQKARVKFAHLDK